jgi:hypothetical protein
MCVFLIHCMYTTQIFPFKRILSIIFSFLNTSGLFWSQMTTKIAFKSNGAHKKPGKGVHECISDPSLYKPLESIKDFRKYLSNFDEH